MPLPSPATDPIAIPESDAPASILLVDDDPNNLLALESILESPEHELVKAHNAEEALIALMHDNFAVIVLDVQMPDLNGIELARLIKQRKRTRHIPIIFLTAHYRESEHAVLGYDVGAVDYLTKPVHPGVLRSKVSVFVELHRKSRAMVELNRSMQAEILERKTADERFRVVVEAAPSAMLLLTPEGSITFANSQAEHLLHSRRTQLHGRFITDFLSAAALPDLSMPPSNWSAAQSAGEMASLPGNVIEIREISLARTDGSRVPVEASLRPIQSREGFRWLATIVDITERKRAESALRTANAELEAKNQALQREAEERMLRQRAEAARAEAEAANAAKDRFLAMLSHELRTPLSPVLHSVALLNEDPDVTPGIRDSLRIIHRNVQLEARLIDDLLDLARIRNGKLELQLQPTDAHETLRNAVEICRADIEARRLSVKLSLGAQETTLLADPARLQQIFWNLITNSVKFTPPSGAITIATRNDDASQLVVEVSDTGLGIRHDKLAHIFNAFEQATQRGSSGLGLGLAICKALTEYHGGKISASSEGPGHGATFRITLPLSEIPLTQTTLEKPASVVALPNALRLLVVEDHPDTADTLRRLLLRRGYEVKSASTVSEALEAAKSFQFDILVTDIGLPDGTGVELFQSLRQRQGESFRGVALSGFGMDEDIARSKAAGFVSHITKPVDFIQLQRCLGEIATSLTNGQRHP